MSHLKPREHGSEGGNHALPPFRCLELYAGNRQENDA